MKKLLAVTIAATFVGCATPKIPDNIPPAPPALRGEPIKAPSATSEAPVEDGFGGGDGFGGDGFGGDTPTVEVQATPSEPKKADAKKDDKKKAADKDAKAPLEDDAEATPADGEAPADATDAPQ